MRAFQQVARPPSATSHADMFHRHPLLRRSSPLHASSPSLLSRTRPSHHSIHTTRPLLSSPSQQQDHYATLSLPTTATPAEIKKSFYRLSKAHHPDLNPSDPAGASQKFVRVSDAYHVLGDPTRRERYDRDRRASAASLDAGATTPGAAGAGSGYSYAAGGRKASGLSRRRGQFRGPPPSFYRNGGWGARGGPGGEAGAGAGGTAEERQRREQAQQQAYYDRESPFAGGAGARGFAGQANPAGDAEGGGASPFSASDVNDVPHFDRASHFRTQASVAEALRQGRRRRRRLWEEEVFGRQGGPGELDGPGAVASFALVCGAMGLGLGLSYLLLAGGGGDGVRKRGAG